MTPSPPPTGRDTRPAGPRSLADPGVLAERRADRDRPHVAPLQEWAGRVAAAQDRPVPDSDPADGGVGATVLVVLETPSRTAAYGSGLVSLDNDDATAANLWRAVAAAGLPRSRLLLANAVPWYVGDADRIRATRSAEVASAAPWLRELVGLLPALAVVLTLGRAAESALRVHAAELGAAGVSLLAAPHPSQRVYNRPDGAARERVHAALARAAELTASPR